ncbi:hypothetical protein MMC24_003907 [Lignoscripta atroalba]|nr:hypothetical protein [Lignoscripta atroalba]
MDEIKAPQGSTKAFFRRLMRKRSPKHVAGAVPTEIEGTLDSSEILAPSMKPSEKPLPPPPLPQAFNDAEESRPSTPFLLEETNSNEDEKLNQFELPDLFYGIPTFSISTGAGGAFNPTVSYPWNRPAEDDQGTDHKLPGHNSFWAVTTHLSRVGIPGSTRAEQEHEDGDRVKSGRNRYESGFCEVPSMLDAQGYEPGSIGFRHFLENSNADAMQFIKHGPENFMLVPDITLLGTEALKKIGIREVALRTIAERLQVLGQQYESDAALVSPHELYKSLFARFIFPPNEDPHDNSDDQCSLMVQIETLIGILGNDNIWIDFSIVDWRVRLGQILFWGPLTVDEDGEVNLSKEDNEREGERKSLFLQILLACELLIRLDEVVVTSRPSSGSATLPPKIRSRKIGWDLNLARVFLENIRVEEHHSLQPCGGLSAEVKTSSWFPFLGAISQGLSSNTPAPQSSDSEVILLPRYPKRQLLGLLHFAETLLWPNIDTVKAQMIEKLAMVTSPSTPGSVYVTPLASPSSIDSARNSYFSPSTSATKPGMKRQNTQHSMRLQYLDSALATNAFSTGGWLSRSWLTGLILAGESSSHLLISTLLENDQQAVAKLGDSAVLYGGFVYEGRSWWSKSCIVGRVLAGLSGSAECMGWITSTVVPKDENRQSAYGWLEVDAKDVSTGEKGRFEEDVQHPQTSSVFGIDHKESGAVIAKDVFVPEQPNTESITVEPQIRLGHVALSPISLDIIPSSENIPDINSDAEDPIPPPCKASITFSIMLLDATLSDPSTTYDLTFNLAHNVHFISAYPCYLSSRSSTTRLASPRTMPPPGSTSNFRHKKEGRETQNH